PADRPLEFKLLDYAPEPWTHLKSVALVKNMQWTLSQGHDDVRLTRVLDSLGAGFFARHYPPRHPGAEPVFPREVLPAPDSAGDSLRLRFVEAPAGAGAGRGRSSGPVVAARSDSLWPRP